MSNSVDDTSFCFAVLYRNEITRFLQSWPLATGLRSFVLITLTIEKFFYKTQLFIHAILFSNKI